MTNGDSTYALQDIDAVLHEPEEAWQRREQARSARALPLPELEKMRIDRWRWDARGTYRAGVPVSQWEHIPEHVRVHVPERADAVLVQHNASVTYAALSPELQARGVRWMSLEDAQRVEGARVGAHAWKLVRPDAHRLAAWHASLWSGGAYLYVPSGVVIEQPIQAVFVADDAQVTCAPHVLIIAERDARVRVVLTFVGEQAHSEVVRSVGVEVYAYDRATVEVSTLHAYGTSTIEHVSRHAHIAADASVEWIVGELSDGWGVSETVSHLIGRGARTRMHAIGIGIDAQRVHQTTRAVHIGKATESEMGARTVMRGEATAIVNGITEIKRGATRANGQQTERMLMLSPLARGDANPILLIDEDDVKAGHAASVGKVSEEHVYYLMSRGLSRTEAQRLIIRGFLAPTIAGVPDEAVRAFIVDRVERKLFV
jgi:Fe-S cluster assembly protein SufD